VDLDAGVRDINVPIAIRDYRNHGDCGIYADVLSSGRLAPGDRLELVVGA
jgi:MOSC domain-containing protein YiiM